MTYSALEARRQLLDGIAGAADELGFALASLGAAYEQLDDATADALEEALFRPVQSAYGRAQRAHAGFADRHGLPHATFETQEAGLPSSRARGFIDSAVEAVGAADRALAGLQDSPLLIEVGDVELRADLAAVREAVGALPAQARELVRRLGR